MMCHNIAESEPLVNGQPDPAKLQAWKQTFEALIAMQSEGFVRRLKANLPFGWTLEQVADYGFTVSKKNWETFKPYAFKLLEDIYAKKIMGATTSKEADATALKKVEQDKDEATTAHKESPAPKPARMRTRIRSARRSLISHPPTTITRGLSVRRRLLSARRRAVMARVRPASRKRL